LPALSARGFSGNARLARFIYACISCAQAYLRGCLRRGWGQWVSAASEYREPPITPFVCKTVGCASHCRSPNPASPFRQKTDWWNKVTYVGNRLLRRVCQHSSF
jgi:hypothetical protein